MAVFSRGLDPLPERPQEALQALYRELVYMREAIEFNSTQVLRKIQEIELSNMELLKRIQAVEENQAQKPPQTEG